MRFVASDGGLSEGLMTVAWRRIAGVLIAATVGAGVVGVPVPAVAALLAAPIVTGVVARDGAVDVEFVPVRAMGEVLLGGSGTPVLITSWPGGRQVVARDPKNHRGRVDGLTNGVEYVFTAVQDGTEVSEPSDPVVPEPAVVPTAPVVTRVVGRDASMVVGWTAPEDGGAPITGYRVTAEPGGQSVEVDGAATEATVPGLANGTEYTVAVAARNKAGEGPAGEGPAVAASAPYPPSAPRQVVVLPVADAGSPTLDVFWEAPADDGGAPVTSYLVRGGPTEQQVTGTTARLSELDLGIEYTISVTAITAAGSGAAEQATQPVSPRVTVAPGTVVLTPPSLAKLEEVGPTYLVFTTPTEQLSSVTVGNILVGDRTTTAPGGFLRKVEQVYHPVTGKIAFGTHTVELDQVVPQGEAAISQTLETADVARVQSTQPGVRLAHGMGGGLGFELNVRSNSDDPHTQAGLTGRVRGSISVSPEVDFQFGFGFFSGPTVQFTATARVEAALEGNFAAYVKSTLIDEELAKVEFQCRTFTIGPVPIVVCPVFTLSATLTAEGSLELSFHGHYQQTIGAQATYDNGSWNTRNLTTAPDTGFTADLQPQVKVTLGFPANLTVLLYGLAGPGLSLVPYLNFTARPADNPWAAIDLGIGLELTFKIPLLELDKSLPLADLHYRLWDTGEPYDGLTVTPPVATVRIGATKQFTATRIGCTSTAPITYTLAPDARGSITRDGLYQAPLLTTDVGIRDIVIATQTGGGCPDKTTEAVVHIGATKPGPPRDVTATADTTGFKLTWKAPDQDGGAPVTRYAVIVTDQFLFGEAHIKWRTSTTAITETPGYGTTARDYNTHFTVLARNSAGWSTLTNSVGITN